MDLKEIPNIVSRIRSVWPVSDDSISLLAEHFTQCSFAKKTVLIREGAYSGKIFFIEKGMTRSYWMVDGAEITTAFSMEGDVEFSMDETYYGKNSEEYLETVEAMSGYQMGIAEFIDAVRSNIELCNWWAIIHQNDYRRIHRSHKERLTLPSTERYREFALQFPEVCRRARLSDIASYLGVTQSTLSRIRAEICISRSDNA